MQIRMLLSGLLQVFQRPEEAAKSRRANTLSNSVIKAHEDLA
jgi:hypothetical protein